MKEPKAKWAGIFYLLTILIGASAFAFGSGRQAAVLVASLCYAVVTVLFYSLFRPVNSVLSLLAMIVGLVGCAVGALGPFGLSPIDVNSLAVFGCYCLLIGYLIFRSIFLPKILGVLMGLGGLGWLTFLSPTLAGQLAPLNMAPGVIGESALTFWLLLKGVDVPRWHEQARRK